MKETNEFSRWSAGAGDAVNRSLADGEITFADLGNLIPTVAGATQAVTGFTSIGNEYAGATPPERDTDRELFLDGLSSVDDDTADLVARGQDGFKAIWALAVKATRKDAAEKLAVYHQGANAMSDPTTPEEWLAVMEG